MFKNSDTLWGLFKKRILICLLFISFRLMAMPLEVNGKSYPAQKLWKMAKIEKKINDPVYKGKLKYKLIPLNKIISLDDGKSLKFTASDGFSVIISTDLFNKGVAYLAIENPNNSWPKVIKGKSAGPYYLVWDKYNKNVIKQEQWPFQIVKVDQVKNVEQLYPQLYPNSLTQTGKRGYRVFMQNCFSCHQLSGHGQATLGPDLNEPMNPTEYFKQGILSKFIRNPKSVRHWKDMRMPSFDKNTITDKEMQDLIKYLSLIKKIR